MLDGGAWRGVQGSLQRAVLPLVSQGWGSKSVCACRALAFLPDLLSSRVPVREFLCIFPLPVLPSHCLLSDPVVASNACQPVCLVHVRECSVQTYGFILEVCSFLF